MLVPMSVKGWSRDSFIVLARGFNGKLKTFELKRVFWRYLWYAGNKTVFFLLILLKLRLLLCSLHVYSEFLSCYIILVVISLLKRMILALELLFYHLWFLCLQTIMQHNWISVYRNVFLPALEHGTLLGGGAGRGSRGRWSCNVLADTNSFVHVTVVLCACLPSYKNWPQRDRHHFSLVLNQPNVT